MSKNKLSVELQNILKKARDKFVEADPAEFNTVANRKVLDGIYTAKVVGLEFDKFGKSAIIRWTYEITDADKKMLESSVGQLVEARMALDSDIGPGLIKRDFARFGYDDVNDLLDDLEESQRMFDHLLGLNPVVKIMVQMDDTDQWQNVYLNDVLEMDEETEAETEVETEEEVEEEEEEEEAEAELEVGDIVEIEYKEKEMVATVVSIDDENEIVKVRTEKPKKVINVSLDKVWLIEG